MGCHCVRVVCYGWELGDYSDLQCIISSLSPFLYVSVYGMCCSSSTAVGLHNTSSGESAMDGEYTHTHSFRESEIRISLSLNIACVT